MPLSDPNERLRDDLSGRFVATLTEEQRRQHRNRSVARYNARREAGVVKAQSQRAWLLWYKYGLSVADFESRLAAQGGACAICRRQFALIEYRARKKSVWHVDHDHTTGIVRGILCFQCNAGLGKFRDDQDLLRSAIDYLSSHDVGRKPECR